MKIYLQCMAALLLCIPILSIAQHSNNELTLNASKLSSEEVKAAISFHNAKRKEVGVGLLTWSDEVAAVAQEWANHLAESNCLFEHRPNQGPWKRKFGENLFWGKGADFTLLAASESWYSEIKDYSNSPLTMNNLKKIGHYTQMVWRNTTQIGFGKAVCKDGAFIIVANYQPTGNYLGEKPY